MFFLFAIQCVRMFEMLKELVLLDLRLQLGLSTGIKLYNNERGAPAQHSFHSGAISKKPSGRPILFASDWSRDGLVPQHCPMKCE